MSTFKDLMFCSSKRKVTMMIYIHYNKLPKLSFLFKSSWLNGNYSKIQKLKMVLISYQNVLKER